MAWSPPTQPLCLDANGLATLEAVAARLIPQDNTAQRIDLASRLDKRLAEGEGKGWRYDALPPEREAMTRGISGVENAARLCFGTSFAALKGEDQDELLRSVQRGEAPPDAFRDLSQTRFFEDLLAALTELYFSHPHAQEEIGYIGFADEQGFHALGLNARDPIEDEASLAPL